MSRFVGYELKWEFVKRIGEELGYHNSNIMTLDVVVERHIKRLTNAWFRLETDYKGRTILTFNEVKGKIGYGVRATKEQRKEVGRILYGDEQEHETSLFAEDSWPGGLLSSSEYEMEFDSLRSLSSMEFCKQYFPSLYPGPGKLDHDQNAKRKANRRRKLALTDRKVKIPYSDKSSSTSRESRKSGMGAQRPKIMSAGRLRKKRDTVYM